MKHYNKLSNAEIERLAILAEECAEVQQIVCKIIRHGYEHVKPGPLVENTTNRERLNNELGDLANIIDMMHQSDDVNIDSIEQYQEKKAANIGKWLRHQ